MRKTILCYSILFGFLITSCEKNDLSKQEILKNVDNSLFQRQSTIFDYVESFHLDNGVECESNILIFPSWSDYDETIDRLDDMIDADCDAFDSTVPNNITDDQYDALADAAGFDEDNVLKKFEDDLSFCSLRKKLPMRKIIG